MQDYRQSKKMFRLRDKVVLQHDLLQFHVVVNDRLLYVYDVLTFPNLFQYELNEISMLDRLQIDFFKSA